MVWKNQKIGIENPKIAKKALLTPTAPSLKMRFSKNTHKPDIFTISRPMKHDDVSIPILKVSPGQDLGTQLQNKVGEIHQKRPRNAICQLSLINTSA